MFNQDNTQLLSKQELRKISGGNPCGPNWYYYQYDGYEGCCVFPIGPTENPCGRVDCDVACGQCSPCH